MAYAASAADDGYDDYCASVYRDEHFQSLCFQSLCFQSLCSSDELRLGYDVAFVVDVVVVVVAAVGGDVAVSC